MKNYIQKGELKMIRTIEEINTDIAVYTEKLSIVKKEHEVKNIELEKCRESNRKLLLQKAGKNIKGASLSAQNRILIVLAQEVEQYTVLISEIESTIKKLNEELEYSELHEEAEDYVFQRSEYCASLEELKASIRAINRNIQNLASIAGKIKKPFASCFLPLLERIRKIQTFSEFIQEQRTASYVDYTRYKDYVASGAGYSVNLEEFFEEDNTQAPNAEKNKTYIADEKQYYQQALEGLPLIMFKELSNILQSLQSSLGVSLVQVENSPVNTVQQHITDFKSEIVQESGIEKKERQRQERIHQQQKDLGSSCRSVGKLMSFRR